ncbi:BTB/POZ domain-containing protein [Verticillium alfalfae VaMs.102]|uniref:BTB/POZ domain-containing protein n=1 Tax=Verticillium alfalfae (strain VaMs.102 / ATCC MYA-4576 / FGSC 10136) TaxID=526221 RepID=C9SBI8_VERA1|nr:BTB/POZ domain-containing protein [Verticillium alfalfae VaMs.102]EEY15722.1 BTB/POZ domain-containing protein [Verticillium alfalfae VaMs.102]
MVLHKGQLEAQLRDEHVLIKTGVLREENPLDLSEGFHDFLQACRRGDLKRCQELISAGVNINGKDSFDYTPLIVSTDPLQPWASHITSLLSKDVPKTADIGLIAASESFQLHKFILASRSPYFKRKFSDAAGTRTWNLPATIPADAFRLVLRYLYLGDIPKDLVDPRSMATEEEVLTSADKISKQLEIEKLWEALLTTDRRLARQRYQDEVNRAQKQIDSFYRENVLPHRMVIDTERVNEIKWRHDNAIFADCLLRADEPDDEQTPENEPADTDAAANDSSIPIGPFTNDKPKKTRRSVVYPPEEEDTEPINIYDVIHAAWDLRVQRLEEFAARYLAYRLEDYIDEAEFADLIKESAERLKNREETDTIELLDDIRYYLSERFRLRFEDAGLDEMMDEQGEINAAAAASLAESSQEAQQKAEDGLTLQEIDLRVVKSEEPAEKEEATEETGGVMTLDGAVAEDEFASDAINYQILLGKIDIMLERLKLDA